MKNIYLIIFLLVFVGVFVFVEVTSKGGGEGSSRKIALYTVDTSSDYSNAVYDGAVQAGAEFGYEIVWKGLGDENSFESQNNIVNNFIENKFCGTVIAASDDPVLVDVVEEIHHKEIPCVIIGSVLETDKCLSKVGTDNYLAGCIAAKRIAELVEGKGKVGLVISEPGGSYLMERIRGFTETIENEFQLNIKSSLGSVPVIYTPGIEF